MTRLIIVSIMLVLSHSSIAQEEKIYTVVEDMPTFMGCENDTVSTRKCTEQALLRYLYRNIKYPSVARENGIEGLIVVSFVVNKKGKVEDIKVIKEPGGGWREEIIRVINTMNEGEAKWKSGKQRGKKVKVRYNVPIRFNPMRTTILSKKASTSDKTIYIKKVNVDKMPIFRGCEKNTVETARKSCTETSLLKYIYKEVDYKKFEKNKTYSIVVSFVVSELGKVKNIQFLKATNKTHKQEIVRVFETMNEGEPKWIAGEHNDEKVEVSYTIPVLLVGE